MGRGGRAEQQLSLRKGDVITVIGDIDIDGYYTAEIHGIFLSFSSYDYFVSLTN